MRVPARLSVVLLVVALALLALPASSMALTVTKTTAPACDTHRDLTDWSRGLSLPRFSVPGVTLTGVTVSRFVEVRSDYRIESRNGAARHDTLTLARAVVELDLPGAATIGANLAAGTRDYSFTAFDGTVDYAGTSGATGGFGVGQDSRVDVLSPAGWVGAGVIVLDARADAATSSTLSGNFRAEWDTIAEVRACVTYTYTEEILVCIGDYVWYDTNKDGIQDPGEQGVAGRTIVVTDANGRPLGTTTTDPNGRWKVCQLEPSTACIVDVDLPDGWNVTGYKTGTRATDSDGIPAGTDARIPDCMTPPSGEDLTFDVGIHQNPVPVEAPAPSPGALRLTKVANAKTIRSGGVVRFTVRVTNRGGRVLRNVRVCDLPPSQFVFTARPRNTTLRNGQLCWTLKTLRAKKTVTLRYAMRAARVPARTCAVNRVTGLAPGTSASARRTVCIRPTTLGMLQLAG